jgi:hypothetical protein
MVVCPPGLMLKWQDEMGEKLGLSSAIVDSAQLSFTLRRPSRLQRSPRPSYLSETRICDFWS